MSANAEDPIDLDAFDAEIVRIAQERFAQGQPQLINALGIQLGPALAKVKAQTGLSFMQYLEQRLSAQFDVIQVKRNTPGLWPKGKSPEGVAAAYAQRPPRTSGSPRYLRWFWNAFAEPLPTGRRFYDPGERMIREAEEPEDASWIEIPPALIRGADEPHSVREIHHRIEQWLNDTLQASDGFVDQVALARPAPGPGRSVLDAVIESLSPRQLQSITMPLDVVAELAKRRA